MKQIFQALKISEKVHWVGAVDWKLRDFHGYATNRGTSYNAYLVLGEKIALLDTVKAPFREEMFQRISSLIEPGEIDYIISNHSEMDHSGCLPEAVEIIRPEKILASKMGKDALENHFRGAFQVTAVNDGEKLNLGAVTLKFIETRMLHWPDSMFTFFEEEGILFSQDAFGMHLASSERFDDEFDEALLRQEAAKYYANILLPFSPLVKKLLESLNQMNLSPKMIAPDHGPIWRKNPNKILEHYSLWAETAVSRKAVVVFDTMWGSTAKMATAVAEGLKRGGLNPLLMPLGASHRSEVAAELLEAGALLVGSPTINGQMFPTVADLLTYLKGLKRPNLVGGAFGSHGWANKAVKQIEESLTEMKVEIAGEGVTAKYVPDEEALQKCFELGLKTAEKVLAGIK